MIIELNKEEKEFLESWLEDDLVLAKENDTDYSGRLIVTLKSILKKVKGTNEPKK